MFSFKPKKYVSYWILFWAYLQSCPFVSATKRIALVEFMQETNSFSPVPTTRKSFETSLLLKGEEILVYGQTESGHVKGFHEAIKEIAPDFEILPILDARSVSGGPIERKVFDEFSSFVEDALEELMPNLDGIYLSLHGAMGVEGLQDPEGTFLQNIRNVVGNDIPIGVSYDLHANLTDLRMKLSTFVVGYRTNPHRDYYQVGYKAGEILIKTIQGLIQPTMAYRKMRLLKGGGMGIDLLHPMRRIFNWMYYQEKANSDILYISNFMVHIWLDNDELGWTTVAVTNNNLTLAEDLAEELADQNWEVRHEPLPEANTPEEAVQIAEDSWILRKFGTVVMCDVSDAVGAGAPGESTWILRALLDHAEKAERGERDAMVSYVTIRDSDALEYAMTHSIGQNVTTSVGGKLDLVTNSPVNFHGELIYKSEDDSTNGNIHNRVVILKHCQGIHLIINEVPDPLHGPDYLQNLGLSLWDADIVVVKNLFPFRYRYLLYNRKTINVVTPGVTNIDVTGLNYDLIPRPIYPLDTSLDTWRVPEDKDEDEVVPVGRTETIEQNDSVETEHEEL